MELLQLPLDAEKLEVVLAVVIFRQGFGNEAFPLLLQFIDFGADGVLAVRYLRSQHGADALHGSLHCFALVDVLLGDGLHYSGLE